jgi:dipeptidyl-peptidase-3
MKAIGDFLLKLGVYKALADVDSMTELYSACCEVNGEYLAIREEVLAKKKPRRVWVQAHTEIVGEGVVVTEFEPTLEGYMKSVLAHFPQSN